MMKYLLEQKKKNKFKLILVILILIIGGFVACKSSCKIRTKAIVDNNNNISVYKTDLESNQADYINALTIGEFADDISQITNSDTGIEFFRFKNSFGNRIINGNLSTSNANSMTIKIYNSLNTLLTTFTVAKSDNSMGLAKFTMVLYNDKVEFYTYNQENRPELTLNYTYNFSTISGNANNWNRVDVYKNYIDGDNTTYYNFIKTYFALSTGGEYATTLTKICANDLTYSSALNNFSDFQNYLYNYYFKQGELNGIETGLGYNYISLFNSDNFKLQWNFQPQENVGTIKKHTEVIQENVYYQLVMRLSPYAQQSYYDLISSQWVEPNPFYPNTVNTPTQVFNDHFLYFNENKLKFNDIVIRDTTNYLSDTLNLLYINFIITYYSGRPYKLTVYTRIGELDNSTYGMYKSSYFLFTTSTMGVCEKKEILLTDYNINYLTFNDYFVWLETPFNALNITQNGTNLQGEPTYNIDSSQSGDTLGSRTTNSYIVDNLIAYNNETNFYENEQSNWIVGLLSGISGFFNIRIGPITIGQIIIIPFAISLCWLVIRIFRGGK